MELTNEKPLPLNTDKGQDSHTNKLDCSEKPSENNGYIDQILALAAKGWPVFPCKQDKKPYTKNGFKDASTEPETIRDWWATLPEALVGVATGEVSGITVVDIDVKDDKRGDVNWHQLVCDNGLLPDTMQVESRSGGAHIYFNYVPGSRINQSKLAIEVDVRSDGGYIICPPSEGYKYINPGTEPAEAPEWLKALMVPVAKPVPEPIHREKPQGDVIDRARKYIAVMPPAIDGQGGHPACYAATVALVNGFDLAEETALDLLAEYNARCVPPWSDYELQHKVRDAATKPHNNPRGYLLNAPLDHDKRTSQNDHTKHTQWPALVPHRAAELPAFDLAKMIPCDLCDLSGVIAAWAEALQVPVESVAGVALGLGALACARSVEVECATNWREPSVLWILLLMPPGERKSALMGMLSKPVHEWTRKERQALGEPVARYEEMRRGIEAKLAAVRQASAKEPAPEKREKLLTSASNLAAELASMPVKLAAPDVLVQSYTPEGLRDLLELNGEKIGIVAAEADAAEMLGMRYSDAGPSIDLMLCGHAGDSITTRRAGGRVVPLSRPAVAMVLAVQPEAIRPILADRAAKGRGLIDRMLLMKPVSLMGSRALDPQPVPPEMTQWWNDRITRLLDLPWPGRCIVNHDGEPMRCASEPRILLLTPEAKRILWELRASLEPRLAAGADLASVSGFVSKLPGACARIALAFTMLRDHQAESVGANSMRAACAWAPYLLAHHRGVLNDAVEKPEEHHAQRLWRALQRRGRPQMTARDLFSLVRDSALPDMEAFRPVLAVLVERCAVRQALTERNQVGRPSELWEVHPDLLTGVSCDLCDELVDERGAA